MDAIKKTYPIRDEKGRPCTFPTFASQVFRADGTPIEKDGVLQGMLPLDVYPVGSIYMSVNETSPASLFGGTWEQLKDRFLLGAGGSYALGSMGGSATQRLTDPAQNARHTHSSGNTNKNGNIGFHASDDSANGQEANFAVTYELISDRTDLGIMVSYSGEGAPFDIMPPYLAVYMWKRVA